MKAEEPDPLLKAVLDESAAFRQSTLEQTLALARGRRRRRFVGRAFAVTAVIAGMALLLRPLPPARETSPPVPALAYTVVHTAPFMTGKTVRTTQARFARVTSASAGIAVVRSEADAVVRIGPGNSDPMIRYLDDQQLLAAFPGEHPVLIAPGTTEARLVFY